jgi:hypothetical protein
MTKQMLWTAWLMVVAGALLSLVMMALIVGAWI